MREDNSVVYFGEDVHHGGYHLVTEGVAVFFRNASSIFLRRNIVIGSCHGLFASRSYTDRIDSVRKILGLWLRHVC